MSLFSKYFQLREETGEKPGITSKVKLQKKEGSNEFGPFVVNNNSHSNLRILIKAFENSDKVGLGYTTIDKSKGEHEPLLKKKVLYLVGGAVRDHLKGKTPRNYDLVTDGTTSEIRMILTHPEAGFTETKPKGHESDSRYGKLPSPGTKNKIFYASRWDKQGKELEFTVEINGEKFEIAPLSKSSKSRKVTPDVGEVASSVEEDSANRDFTINALYLPLTNSDGENADLIDPHGGAHHLKNKNIVAVNDDFDGRMTDDPSTALRMTKLISRFGDPDNIPEKFSKSIAKFKDFADVPKSEIKDSFLSGLECPDSDPKKYVGMFKNMGLLDKVLPGANADEIPEDFRGDRWLSTAWLLKDQDPKDVKKILTDGEWSAQEANDVAYLVKLYHWGSKNKFDSDMFYDIKKMPHGLTKSKIREWMQMAKSHGPEVDAFLDHDDSDITAYVKGKDGGKSVNPEFSKMLGGRTPFGGEFDTIKRMLSTKKWKDSIKKSPQ